jgi:hypothetical protein
MRNYEYNVCEESILYDVRVRVLRRLYRFMWDKLHHFHKLRTRKQMAENCASLCAVCGSFVFTSNDVHRKQVRLGARPLL